MCGTLELENVKNFKSINTGTQLLFCILQCVHPDGTLLLKKTDFSDYLGISPQTAGKYISEYVASNIMKYKYSGKSMVNPDFYYAGLPEDKDNVRKAYQAFKSDM